MQTIAYIRISDSNKQDASTQREAVKAYADKIGAVITQWVEEHVSASKTSVEDRELSTHINSGHRIIMTDATRLGRRKVFDLLGVIGSICKNGGSLHFAYSERIIDESNMDDAETIFTVVGGSFAAVEESKSRSARATAAHARRKNSGLSSGRRKGAIVKSKLDDYAPNVQAMLLDGLSKAKIMRRLKDEHGVTVSRQGFYNWLDNRGIAA